MAAKTERLEMRLSADHKALIERAAAAAGLPLTAFAVSNLLERAEETLERYERTVLSARDQQIFMEILEADDEPVPALAEAAKNVR